MAITRHSERSEESAFFSHFAKTPRAKEPDPLRGLALRLQPRVHRNLRLEKLRHRAARLRILHGRIEFRLVRARNLRHQIEMTLRDAESLADFLQRNRRRR